MMFLASMSLTKISVLLFFLRLVNRRCHTALYYTVHAGIAFIVLCFIAFFFVLIFACKPVNAVYLAMDWTWNGDYNCAAREMSDLFNGVCAIASDVYSVLLPVFIVRGLQITRGRKIMLYIVFCCGLAVIGASIARTVAGKRIYKHKHGDITCECQRADCKDTLTSDRGRPRPTRVGGLGAPTCLDLCLGTCRQRILHQSRGSNDLPKSDHQWR